MNLTSSLAVTLTLVLTSYTAFSTEQHYQITDLGTLGGDTSRAYSINDFGDIVGRSREVNKPDGKKGLRSAFIYTNSHMINLGNFGGSNIAARSVNSSRQVVGYARPTDSTNYKAFLYEYGEMKNLGTLESGLISYAYSINEYGQVVGQSHTNKSGTTSEAFIYEDEKMMGLGTLGGNSSGAFDINADGVVVGTSTLEAPSHDIQAFIYEDDEMTSLGCLDDTGYSEARAINDNNQVVGNSLTESGHYHAFLYEEGEMYDLGSIEGDSFAYDINNHGQIVGSYRSHLLEGSGLAYLYENNKMKKLNDLLAEKDKGKWKLTAAFGINNKGQIVGWGKLDKKDHAYLLTPSKAME